MKNKKVKINFFIPRILPNSRRGLSTVVTSLILILLVLVAVGIIWIVIMKIISSGTEQVSLGKLTMNLEIKKVEVHDAGIDVQVKRNTGAGELSGIKFIVSDGVDTQIFEMPTTMGELATKRFTLPYIGLVKEVSIAGIFETSSGKEFTGNEIDNFEFSNKEIIKNLGGISWWRFENNAVDEIGGNDGSLEGGVDCNVEGKYGKACDFDGNGDNIGISNSLGLGENSFTFSHWIKTTQTTDQVYTIGNDILSANGYRFGISNGRIKFLIGNSITNYIEGVCGTDIANDGGWHLITGVYDRGNAFYCYIDGVFGDSISIPFYEGMSDSNTGIGAPPCCVDFNGTIDEVQIFNKALSEKQVKALYELDLI